MTRIVDPGLRYMTAMAEIWGRMALRLANAQVLPYDLALYADRVDGFLTGLAEAPGGEALDLAPARAAVAVWKDAATDLGHRVQAALQDGPRDGSATAFDSLNTALIRVERQLLLPGDDGSEQAPGIPGRPWFLHALYAPRYTYAAMSLPGVTEALEHGDEELARHELARLTAAIQRAAEATRQAAAMLPS